jgi:hypothetical protein
MITMFVGVAVLGALAGASSDELLRGRDPRSRRVLAAGIVGAIGGLAIQSRMSDHTWLLEVMAALLGALMVASVTRVRISSTLASSASA